MRINELVEILTSAAQEYYTTGESDLSDTEYDNLLEELYQLDPNNPILTKVGHGYVNDVDEKEKFEHPVEVGSIKKTKSISELIKFLDSKSTASTKIDGNSICVYYRDGVLQNVVTRGADNIGIIRTYKFVKYNLVPKFIKLEGYIMVRGEAAILKSKYTEENDFDILKSSRNAVCGAITRIDDWDHIFKHLDFIAYTFINVETGEDVFDKLNWEDHFIVEHQTPFDNNHPLLKNVDELKMKFKTSYRYDSDGIVFKNSQGEYLAFKFADETARTIQRKIVVTIAIDQRLTPISHFDSVQLSGANISKASLNSFSRAIEIGAWPLKENHEIELIRANEIIPYITRTFSTSDETHSVDIICPCCGSIAEFKGKHAFCVNTTCPNIERSKLIKFSSFFYPEMLSDKTVSKVFDHLKIYKIKDAITYNPNRNEILSTPTLGYSKTDLIIEMFNKMKEPYDVKIIYQSLIESCGRSGSEKIIESKFSFDDYISDKDFNTICQPLHYLPNFNSNIITNLQKQRDLIREVVSVSKIKENKLAAKVGSFAITGIRFSKEQLAQLAEIGWREDSSVKKDTTYLVVKDTKKTSEKIEKARKLGTKIVSIEEFFGIAGLK